MKFKNDKCGEKTSIKLETANSPPTYILRFDGFIIVGNTDPFIYIILKHLPIKVEMNAMKWSWAQLIVRLGFFFSSE